MLRSLVHEVFQTEVSAAEHSRRTAEQLGDIPPAATLMKVSEQAGSFIEDLDRFAREHRYPVSHTGRGVGRGFSSARNFLQDRLLTREKTYRGTLLGMRHGVDLVQLLRNAARNAGEDDLADWCTQWLEMRRPLVTEAMRQLSWFAEHPDVAMAPVRTSVLLGGIRRALTATGDIRTRLRGNS